MEIHSRLSTLTVVLVLLLSSPCSTQQLEYTQPYVDPHVTVPENAPLGHVLTTITDTAPHSAGKIVSVDYQGPDQAFYASRLSGQPKWQVKLNRSLDYETQVVMQVSFQARGGLNVDPTDVLFKLHVRDVNDNPPQFLHLPYNAQVDEDASLGTSININIAATDVDTGTGGTVRYQLVPVSQGSTMNGESTFLMNDENGHVTLNGALDYESKIFYHYRVVARDRGTPSLNSSTDLFITVQDVQDSPPVFVNIPYVASVPEGTTLTSSVLTVRAVDQDRAVPNAVTYNITHSSCPGLFRVEAENGTIRVSGVLDRDVPPLKDLNGLCTIHLQATEQNGGHPQRGNFTAVATATISVDDLNDNAPFFPHNSFTASISENSPSDTPLQLTPPSQHIVVTDIDQGPNSVIQLSLETESETFELSTSRLQSTGSVQLRVRNSSRLDYERFQTLVVKIRASDGGAGHRAVTATVTVSVVNVNEFPPQFSQQAGGYTATVPEGSPPTTHVTTVTATDRDTGDYGNITYRLSNARGLFIIDRHSGEVSVASNQTDREREARYFMIVVATDGGGLEQTVPLTITISDVNDNPPVFLRHQFDVILSEGSRNFSQNVVVQATDADEEGTENSNVTYTISSTRPGNLESHFHLDRFSGQLTVVQPLDYDVLHFPAAARGSVQLGVVAKDHGSPTRLSAAATVVITLTDINDNKPEFQHAPYATTILERSHQGSFVFNISARDRDGSAPNNVITYSIESGGQDRFRINPDTGIITVSGQLDREQVSNYSLVIVARDRAAAPRSSSTTLTIGIADVNDELPTFGDKVDARLSVNETVHGLLYDMSASDPDLNSALSYEIVDAESSVRPEGLGVRDWLRIDTSSGQVFATKPLDRTAVHTLVLRVRVTDTNGTVQRPQRNDATLTITVLDINNHGPQFSPSGTVPATIRENMGTGTALTLDAPLRVLDMDEGDNSLFEVQVTGQYRRYFEVLPSTVQSSADLVIRVKNNSILDYEARTSLDITLSARETRTTTQHHSTVKISVTLEDENDHSPHFHNDTYFVTIPESAPAGTSVATITATDDDGSVEFNKVTYSHQGAENVFAVNASTGMVTLLTNTTDYDTPPNTYQLTLVASDSEGRRGNALLTVALTDINDLSPEFDHPVYVATLQEEHTEFERPLVVNALDGDEPGTPNSNVSYAILGSHPPGLSSNFSLRHQYSGVLDVAFPVDLESLSSSVITLTVQARDGSGRSSTASVEVHVLDVNDHAPQFSAGSILGEVSVLENATVGTLVHTFHAIDGDSTSPNNNVTYLISSGANDQFSLDERSGQLTVSRRLDREQVPHYSLVVLALDRGLPQRTSTATLGVAVADVNDVSPEFVRSSVSVDVEENEAGVVYTMAATDEDVDPRLRYNIVWNHGTTSSGSLSAAGLRNLFHMNASTGVIRINGILDRETLDSAVLAVKVQDQRSQTGPQIATGTVTITVKDQDDNRPEFTNSNLTVSVDENAAQGVPIIMPQISVVDRDQGENAEFQLRVTENVSSTIEVVPSTAAGSTVVVLRVGPNSTLLDYEKRSSLHFQIWAVGTKNSSLTTHCDVTLHINNMNDNLPQFQRHEYTANINESTHMGTTVTTVKATDEDSGSLGTVSYSILGDSTLFSVDNTTGVITTSETSEHYDFEKTPEYYLTVMATDGGGATTTTRVHVILHDINDQDPVFLRSEYLASIKENSLRFDTGATVKARDNDKAGTPNSEVFYRLEGASNFTVNSSSGELGIRSPVNYEAVSHGVVRLIVIATDRGSPPRSSSATIVVAIQDMNDFVPVFDHTTYVGNVTEGSQNTDVLIVHAEDEDGSAPNNEVFYLLASGGNDKFKVDSSTGQLSTLGDIDREVKAAYTLIVQAVDKGSPPKTASTTVVIHVDNVNDDVPRFVPPEVSVTVVEGRGPGTSVYGFEAVDNDEDARLRYRVLWNQSSGYDENLQRVNTSVLQNAFSVETTNGTIIVNQALDREMMETAKLVIFVRDTNATGNSAAIQTATGTVNIQIRDVDDHPPIFSSSVYSASLLENSPERTPIHLPMPVSISDPDKGTNSQFRLSLSTNCLRISPSTARAEVAVVISVARTSCFDYERQQFLRFKVFAESQGASAYKTNASVRVNINNTNDMTPHFTLSEYSTHIPENMNVSSVVIDVRATDLDKLPFNTFFYSLQGGDGVFSINNLTGQVSVAKAQLDYETRQQYQLTVEATDIGGLRDSVPLTISLTDLNDNTPRFVRPEYQAFVVENQMDFERGVRVEAEDADGTEENKGVHYSLSPTSQWSSNFSINASTGLLMLTTPLDYEALSNDGVINLVVLATDQGSPERTGSVNVTVTVQDVNDEAPVFSAGNYRGNVTENGGRGISVTQVEATDGDKSAPNNEVFYVIAGGGNDQFQVNSTSGVISTVVSLDREQTSAYNLTVLAMDRGSPAFTASTTVSIIVDNINDDPPRFVIPQLTVSFPETRARNATITYYNATDGDADAHLMYKVLWNVSTGLDDRQQPVSSAVLKNNFQLMGHRLTTGFKRGLDRETVESAILYIQVTDTNAAPKTTQTATGTISIQVEDIDDNPPTFSAQWFSAIITENSPLGTPLQFNVSMIVTDVDKDENSAFTLSLSNYSRCLEVLPSRAITQATVLIRVTDPTCFDYEKDKVADFQIIAVGAGSGSFTTNTTVHLNIININDETPKFTASFYNVSVSENLNVSASVIVVQADDADSEPFDSIVYSLQGGDGKFSINNLTGQVSVAKAQLDYETRQQYRLTVEATDIGGLRDSVPLTISLTDLNDNTPRFVRPEYQAFVVENQRDFKRGVRVEAEDADGTEENKGVHYSLSPTSQWSSNFSINASTGLLMLTTPLDYEALGDDGVINLVVLATDQGSPPLTGSVNVTITVQDVNDEAPVFSGEHYSGNITENQASGISVTKVHATDGDKSAPNNEVFYVIAGGGNDQFQVNSTSGVISTVVSLDREQTSAYNLTVLAMDRGSPAFTASTTVSIIVDNINDDPPRFVVPQLTVSFPETRARNATITYYNATDGDADAHLMYKVLWNVSTGLDDRQQPVSSAVLKSNFQFTGHRLMTDLNLGLDRETLESAILYIQVTDTNAYPGTNQTATGTVSIQVEDIDDNPPTFSAQWFSANITENSPRGTPLQFNVSMTVTDVDKDKNSAFTLSLSNYTRCLEVLPSRAASEATVLIRVKDPTCFDYERDTVADFEVIAVGAGNGNFTTNTSVHLTISNIDDETPAFKQAFYNVSVPENLNVSDVITTVQAEDADSPPYEAIVYSLQGGDGTFSINNLTGQVSVAKAQLDYETRQQYRLTVEATDIGGLRDSVPLTISLTDLNDNTPRFVRPDYQAFILENHANFDTDIYITATDLDKGVNQEIQYSLSPGSQLAGNFTVDPSTGRLSVRNRSAGLDYEALPDTDSGVVNLTVLACDQGTPSLCANVSVFVTVRDENDNTPIFLQSYHGNMSENAPLDTPLLTVSAKDGDGRAPNNKVFYVISGPGSDKFKVDSSTGNVTRAGQLDSDTQAFYNLTLRAIDGGSPPRSSSTFVTVHVLDVNDVPPEFRPKARSVDVNESDAMRPEAPGRVLETLWATDPDRDSELLYSVVWSECRGFGPNQERLNVSSVQNAFEVDSRSGEVRVNGTNLDRETLSRAVLVVNVTDQHAVGPPQHSTGTLTINVVDVNDHKPRFNQASYTAQIAENAIQDSVLHIVSTDHMNVIDLDTDQNCVFRISVDGPESEFFTAEPSTAARSFALVQLRVRNGSVLDYEKRHNITFNVTATETSTSDLFSNTVTVVVHITDVNDNSPFFGRNFSASVRENSPPNANITTVTASDEDSGRFGEISYSLEGDAARFSINPMTGEIQTADDRLDRETRDTYMMTVVATDGGGRRTGAPLTISITDDNDETPRFQSNYSSKVEENTVLLSPPVVLQARDGDLAGTPNSNVTYHLHFCHPVDCLNFTLDQVSGQLTLNSRLDFEQTTMVELVVVARDQGIERLTGTATVNIQVEDVNDVDPVFTQELYIADIYENAEEGKHVDIVSAHDSDGTSPNNDVFYVLDSGRGSDKFRVNSTSGLVTVGPGAMLDRESDDSYSLILLALDRGDPPRSATATLSVSLQDINDEVPVFIEDRKSIRLPENVEVGHVVEMMNATDPDVDSVLVYSWVLEESQATTDRDVPVTNLSWISTWFSVNASRGVVTVASELDREFAEVVVLKILVNDTKGTKNLPQTALATLTVTLSDVNDNHPVISGSESLRVSEALAVGTEVASFTATDADRDQKVTFSILSEAAEAYFNISSEGKLSLQRQIDRERTPTLNFTVIATDDGSPPLSSNLTIPVTVLDANDNDPQFQDTSYSFSVPEDAPEGALVVIINATDKDEGANANVTFDFADNVYDFVINKTTGAIFVQKPLDRETQSSYSFGIAALDNPITDVKRRTIQPITIMVTDVNDNAPVFSNLPSAELGYTAQIDETKTAGDRVLNVQPGLVRASDQDEGSNSHLSFYLISQDGVDYFRMNPATGEILVNASIRGEAGVYNYTVTVVDGGDPPLNASANLTVEVLDQNLNDPQFESRYADIPPIPECSAIGTSIVTFLARDADRNKETNGRVQYFFDNTTSNPADLPYFSLNPDTGLLTSAQPFNRELQALFHIGVVAQDKGVPNIRHSKPLKISIHVDDGNDNGPQFNVTQYHFTVPEGQEGISVGQVYAKDLDDFKRTCYTLDGSLMDHFNISSPTDRPADLQLTKALDRENAEQASFSLTVTATDCTLSAGACDMHNFSPVLTTVHVTVSDVNDNPPNFTRPSLTFGLTSTADAGHVIANLQEYVSDPDLGSNRVHAFYPVGSYQMDDKLRAGMGGGPTAVPAQQQQSLALSVNGSLSTRTALPGDAEGFFTWTILANDSAGEDTVLVKIYVVGKDKLIKISFFTSVEELRHMQDDIIRDLSEQTGLQFVADDREPFEDSNGIDSSKSVLIVHAVDENEDAMNANKLMDFLDHQVKATESLKTRYRLYNIETYKKAESNAMDDLKKTEYILAAVICVLVFAFLITLYVMLSNIRRFKRKLKAATIETYPMTKQALGQGIPGLKTPQTNPIFGKDGDLAIKEVDVDRTSNHSDVSLDNNSVDFEASSQADSANVPDEDEQEVTLDLYGEDTEQPSSDRRDPTFYLDQALAEHDERKKPQSHSHMNGVGLKQNGVVVNGGLTSAHALNGQLAQTLEFDLEGCESSDI